MGVGSLCRNREDAHEDKSCDITCPELFKWLVGLRQGEARAESVNVTAKLLIPVLQDIHLVWSQYLKARQAGKADWKFGPLSSGEKDMTVGEGPQ